MRLAALLAHDVRLQYRYGIYAAYAFIVAVYAGVLHWGAPYLPGWAVAFIIFTDPAALGFFFLGALMMLEKSELVRLALATTPMTALEYYTSKLVTLLALSLVACLCLLIVHSGEDNLALLLAAVSLTSIQYVGLGVLVAYHFATVNGYLIGSAVVLTPVIAPGLLALIDPMPAWLMLVPAASQLRLTMVATGAASANGAEILAMLAVSGAAAILASWAAVRRLRREFGK
jgi:fluoroquinolone transport system permease protein